MFSVTYPPTLAYRPQEVATSVPAGLTLYYKYFNAFYNINWPMYFLLTGETEDMETNIL